MPSPLIFTQNIKGGKCLDGHSPRDTKSRRRPVLRSRDLEAKTTQVLFVTLDILIEIDSKLKIVNHKELWLDGL